jgi:hypothetical protein
MCSNISGLAEYSSTLVPTPTEPNVDRAMLFGGQDDSNISISVSKYLL